MNDTVVMLAVVLMVVAGQVMLKLGMNTVGEIGRVTIKSPLSLAIRVARTPAVLVGLALYGASALGWVYVLSRMELSYAYPFLALSYVGVTATAVAVLKEPFRWSQWTGVALVAAGVIVVALTA